MHKLAGRFFILALIASCVPLPAQTSSAAASSPAKAKRKSAASSAATPAAASAPSAKKKSAVAKAKPHSAAAPKSAPAKPAAAKGKGKSAPKTKSSPASASAPASAAASTPAESAPAAGPSTRPGDFVAYPALDREPMQKSKPDPMIPDTASNRHLNGLVSVTVTINEKGGVDDAVLLNGLSPDYGLNAACVEAARKMRFSPPIKDGVPVKTKKTVTYKFAG